MQDNAPPPADDRHRWPAAVCTALIVSFALANYLFLIRELDYEEPILIKAGRSSHVRLALYDLAAGQNTACDVLTGVEALPGDGVRLSLPPREDGVCPFFRAMA